MTLCRSKDRCPIIRGPPIRSRDQSTIGRACKDFDFAFDICWAADADRVQFYRKGRRDAGYRTIESFTGWTELSSPEHFRAA